MGSSLTMLGQGRNITHKKTVPQLAPAPEKGLQLTSIPAIDQVAPSNAGNLSSPLPCKQRTFVTWELFHVFLVKINKKLQLGHQDI